MANMSFVSTAEARPIATYQQWGEPRIQQLNFVFSPFHELHFDEPGTIDAYVDLDVFSRRRGITMGKNDLWIAATAKIAGATLLTTDKDLDHLHGQYLKRIWIDPTI